MSICPTSPKQKHFSLNNNCPSQSPMQKHRGFPCPPLKSPPSSSEDRSISIIINTSPWRGGAQKWPLWSNPEDRSISIIINTMACRSITGRWIRKIIVDICNPVWHYFNMINLLSLPNDTNKYISQVYASMGKVALRIITDVLARHTFFEVEIEVQDVVTRKRFTTLEEAIQFYNNAVMCASIRKSLTSSQLPV